MTTSPTRELARRAVRREIAEVAERLFVEHGYDQTTVDAISTAVGISSRTFFRYFASKDEVLFLRIDALTRSLVDAVAQRPTEESPWRSLLHAFRSTMARVAEDADAGWSKRVETLADNAPSLVGIVLKRLAALEEEITELLLDRAAAAENIDVQEERAKYRAMVGASFAAFSAVIRGAGSSPAPDVLAKLDTVFDSLRPSDPVLGG